MTIVLLLLACVPDDPPPPVDTTDTVDTDPPVPTPRVVIHEVMTRNDATLLDPDAPCAEYDDWIELLDADEVPVDLGGWRLGTRRDGSDAWTLPPTALSPGGYALITADATPDQGPLHAPFKLDGDGAEVWLWAPDGAAVDHVALPALAPDVSWGRLADGSFGPLPLPSPGAANAGWPDDPCLAPPTGFDDHTYPCIGSTDSYFVLSRARTGLRTVKFDILSFSDPAARRVVFLDTAFYDLHDEWYLFRMLNDQPVEGEDVYPPYPGAFADVDAIYTWADTIDLASTFDPGFITRAGLRITAPHYYELALDTDPRVIGVGVLVYAPPVDPADPPTWAFELEYGDTITVDEVTTYFEVLAAATPPEIGDHLRWLIRSPSQERTAASMEAGALPYHDRVLRYAELARPGEVEVYHPGLAAGRVRLVRAGEEGLDKAVPDDLLVLDAVPDELPPGAALLTAVPQTPLAHVALLAESRGIPNAYVAGITADPEWDQWGRVHAWVALRATADGGVRAQALTNPQIGEWNRIKDQPIGVFTPPDLTDAPLTVDLTTTPADQMDALRPILGGKCAGMLVLLDQGVDAPDAPLCVTVRAYADQIAALDWLPGVLADPMFAEPGDPRARYLVLEGARAYLQRYAGPGDRAFLTQHDAAHPPGDRLGDLARGEGLRGAVRDTPVPAATLDPIAAAIAARFRHLAPSQGLRFRSSSNLEDLEGFNGAGLYASYTGWLVPPASDPDATIARALQQAWASYWGAEAFEERHAAGIDPLAGGMGVLVHPAFQDEAERANGVVTITRLPDGHADRWEMTVNAQIGAISVTNPPVDDTCRVILPEVARVTQADGGAPVIARVQASTEAAQVLDDDALLGLLDDLQGVVDRWLAISNAGLPPEQRRSTLTLDLELRDVEPGWPEMADGSARPARLVLKQARTLEPSSRSLPGDVQALPYPRDVLARARRVELVACTTDTFTLRAEQATTDPLARPDMGYAAEPFLASLQLWFDRDVPTLGWRRGEDVSATWVQLDPAWPATASSWAVDVGLDPAVPSMGGGRLTVEADGAWTWTDGARSASGAAGTCTVSTRWSSPQTWLDDLFAAP